MAGWWCAGRLSSDTHSGEMLVAKLGRSGAAPLQRAGSDISSLGEGKDEEAAFAGDDDGESAAIGRNGKIAEANAVKERHRLRL